MLITGVFENKFNFPLFLWGGGGGGRVNIYLPDNIICKMTIIHHRFILIYYPQHHSIL